jgi:F-type H+-transporting ATPase subunit b
MSFNLSTFIFELLNFIVLVLILRHFLYGPIHKAIDDRRQHIQQEQAAAAAAQAKAADLQQQLTTQLSVIDNERRQVMAQAHADGEAERQRLLADAEREARRRSEAAAQSLAQDRQDALASLQSEIIDEALALTTRLLGGAGNENLPLVARQVIRSLGMLTSAERDKIRATWQPGAEVVIETTTALDAATLGDIEAAVTATIGQRVPVTVRMRPELVGGLRVRLGGDVWDASVQGQLEDMRHAAIA